MHTSSPYTLVVALLLAALLSGRITQAQPEQASYDELLKQVQGAFATEAYDQGIPLAEKLVQAAKASGEAKKHGDSLFILGQLYESAKKPKQALEHYEQASKVYGPGKDITASKRVALAKQLGVETAPAAPEPDLAPRPDLTPQQQEIASEADGLRRMHSRLYRAGKLGQAAELAQREGRLREQLKEVDPTSYATALNNLALMYQNMGDHRKAEPMYLQALEVVKESLGEDHPHYASSLNNLAALYCNMGDHQKAEPLFWKSMEIRKKVLGEEHPHYATSLNNLAKLYEAMGEPKRAATLRQRVSELQTGREKAAGKKGER